MEQLDVLLLRVAHDEHTDALTADQARSLCSEAKSLKHLRVSSAPHPILQGQTIGRAKAEELKVRMVSLLATAL